MLMLSCKADVPCTYVELILSCDLRPIFLMQCAMRLSLYALAQMLGSRCNYCTL